jgi:hypothetical protein
LVVPDDELDELYCVNLSEFTALRAKLAAAVKQRDDAATAQQISAARKPSTAAWVVNRLTLQRKETKQRLKDLGTDCGPPKASGGFRKSNITSSRSSLVPTSAPPNSTTPRLPCVKMSPGRWSHQLQTATSPPNSAGWTGPSAGQVSALGAGSPPAAVSTAPKGKRRSCGRN